MRAGGRGVLGVYYLLENIIHYYYCQSEVGGKTAVKGGKIPPFPSPPTRKDPVVLISSKFLKKPKAIVQGFFLGSEKMC